MTAPARPGARPRGRQGSPDERPGATRPLAVTGAVAACVVMVTGLVILTPLVLVGWIAAPHAGLGLPGVLRTATGLWLAAHHVGFALRGAGRIGMLPLGLVLIPGSLLWLAGRWVARTGQLTRLSEVGYAALALAAPYAVLCGALALASRSALATPSLPQAVVAGFLIALCAGGLGGARALAPWDRLARLLPPRPRSVVLGTAGTLAVLVAAGAILAGGSLAAHLQEFRSLNDALGAGAVGSVLLLLVQFAYVPNAVIWAVCFTLGPGFAFGAGTVVAPTGAALGPLPMFPHARRACRPGPSSVPGWVSVAMLVVPVSGRGVRWRAAGARGTEPGRRDSPAVGLRLRCGHRMLSPGSWRRSRVARWAAGGWPWWGRPGGRRDWWPPWRWGWPPPWPRAFANWLRLRREPGLAAALAVPGRPAPAHDGFSGPGRTTTTTGTGSSSIRGPMTARSCMTPAAGRCRARPNCPSTAAEGARGRSVPARLPGWPRLGPGPVLPLAGTAEHGYLTVQRPRELAGAGLLGGYACWRRSGTGHSLRQLLPEQGRTPPA